MTRVAALLVVVACSKSAKEPPRESPPPTPPAVTHEAPVASAIVIKSIPPADPEIAEEWIRDIADPHVRDVQGAEAYKTRDGHWQVTVYVMEFIRDVPLEVELRKRIPAALSAVPGASDVKEEDREVWSLRGDVSGRALVEAVARVVDELAPQSRAEYERDVK